MVGAPLVTGINGYAAGHVLLYKKNGATWSLEQNLTPGDLKAGDQAGFSVDIDDDLVAFGAPFKDNVFSNGTSNLDAGRVYIYQKGASNWVSAYQRYGNTAYSGLGYSVSVSTGRVAAGEPLLDLRDDYWGRVVIYYKTNATNWDSKTLQAPLDMQHGNRQARFGMAVVLKDDFLLVGAPSGQYRLGSPDFTGYFPGTALLYQLSSPNVNQITRFNLLDQFFSDYRENYDYFGQSVGIGSGSFIISNHNKPAATYPATGAVLFGSLQ